MLTSITRNRRRILGATAATIAAGALGLAGSAELWSRTPQVELFCFTFG